MDGITSDCRSHPPFTSLLGEPKRKRTRARKQKETSGGGTNHRLCGRPSRLRKHNQEKDSGWGKKSDEKQKSDLQSSANCNNSDEARHRHSRWMYTPPWLTQTSSRRGHTPRSYPKTTVPRRTAQQENMAVEHITYTDVNARQAWRRWGNGGGFTLAEAGGGGGEAVRGEEGRIAGIETFVVGWPWVLWATVEDAAQIISDRLAV